MAEIQLSDADKLKVQLLKSIYTGRPDMLKATRKLVLGLNLSDEDKGLVEAIKSNKDLMKYLESVLNPTVHGDEEIFMVNDVWFQVNLKDKAVADAKLFMEAVQLTREYMQNLFAETKVSIADFDYSKTNTPDSNLTYIMARNLIIQSVETTLRGIKALAGDKEETLEELSKRLEKNSNK